MGAPEPADASAVNGRLAPGAGVLVPALVPAAGPAGTSPIAIGALAAVGLGTLAVAVNAPTGRSPGAPATGAATLAWVADAEGGLVLAVAGAPVATAPAGASPIALGVVTAGWLARLIAAANPPAAFPPAALATGAAAPSLDSVAVAVGNAAEAAIMG